MTKDTPKSKQTRRSVLKKSSLAGIGLVVGSGGLLSATESAEAGNGNEPRGRYYQESEVHYETGDDPYVDGDCEGGYNRTLMQHCSLGFTYWDSFENGTGEALHQFSNAVHASTRWWDSYNDEWDPVEAIDYLKNRVRNLNDTSTSLVTPEENDARMVGIHSYPEYQGGTKYDYNAATETAVKFFAGSVHPAVGALITANDIYNNLANTGNTDSGQDTVFDWSFGNYFGGQKRDATGTCEFYIEGAKNEAFDVQVEGDMGLHPNPGCPTTSNSPDTDEWTAIRLAVTDPNVDEQASSSSIQASTTSTSGGSSPEDGPTKAEVARAKGPGERLPFDEIDNPVLKDFAKGGPLIKRKYPVSLVQPTAATSHE